MNGRPTTGADMIESKDATRTEDARIADLGEMEQIKDLSPKRCRLMESMGGFSFIGTTLKKGHRKT